MPPTNILDADLNKAATKLHLVAKGSGIDFAKCKYKLFVNDEAQEPKEMTAGEGEASADVAVRAVKDDEQNYKVRWSLIYDGKDLPQAEEWLVWPETIKVVTKTEDGSKALGKVGFTWTVDGKVTDYETNDSGEHLLRATAADWLTKPSSIALKSGWEDQKKNPGTGRIRTYHVKRVTIAEFLSPKPDKNPMEIKQWVNVTADKNHPEYGSAIEIQAGIKDNAGKKDDVIFVKATFGMESKRNSPKPELKATGVEGLASKVDNGKTIYTGKVKLGENAAPAKFSLELGAAGMCTCQVDIGTTDECKDASIIYTTWRKLYFHFTRPKSLTAPVTTTAKTAFEAVGIDFEEYVVADAVMEDNDKTIPAAAWVDGAIIESGKVGKMLVVGDHNVDPFKKKFSKKAEGASAHIIVCNYQLDAKDKEYNGANIEVKDADQIDWPPKSGTKVRGIQFSNSQIPNDSALFFSKDLRDGTDAVKECSWSCKQDPAKKGDIDISTHVTIDQAKYGNNVYIKLPDDAAKLLDDDKAKTTVILIKIRVAYALGWYNGWCTGGDRHNVVKGGRADRDICGTIVHECGHAINQAANDETHFPGLDKPPHGRQYSVRGHSGSHCADGIDAPTYNNKALKLNTAAASAVCTCIMYGAGSAKRNSVLKFCAKCEPYVLGVAITEVTKP